MNTSFHRRLVLAAKKAGLSGSSAGASHPERALPGTLLDGFLSLRTSLAAVPPGSAAALLRGLGLLPRVGETPATRRPKAPQPGTPPGADFRSGTFTSPSGTRPYRLFVPSRPKASPPLLVMLHGCTQTAEDFAAGTRMNELAEARGWLVLYPVQLASANMQRCWNWFQAGDQQRGHGEPALIAEMTRMVMAENGVDPHAVFAAGLSAGGAEAAVLGALYPDLFAAIGVHSGLACGAASDMSSAFAAMRNGRAGAGHHTIPTIVFHGDRDTTVNPRNADEVRTQVTAGAAASTEQGRSKGGLAYDRAMFRGADGRIIVEQWTISGAGHAWSGGSPDGSYTEPKGPDASAEMLRFFESHRK